MKSGQASLEYLIVLAIGLIIALVVLTFLGFMPNFGLNIQFRNSETFWSGQARPFAIVEANYLSANRMAYLAVENMNMENLTITSIFINDTQIGFYEYNLSYTDGRGPSALVTSPCTPPECLYNFTLKARQMRRIVTDTFMSSDELCGIGGSEGLVPFRMNYTRNSYGGNFVQIGSLPLGLKCLREM